MECGEKGLGGPGWVGGERSLGAQCSGERGLGAWRGGGWVWWGDGSGVPAGLRGVVGCVQVGGPCPGAPGERAPPPEESSFWLPLYGSMCCRLAAQPRCMAAPVTSGFLRLQVSAGDGDRNATGVGTGTWTGMGTGTGWGQGGGWRRVVARAHWVSAVPAGGLWTGVGMENGGSLCWGGGCLHPPRPGRGWGAVGLGVPVGLGMTPGDWGGTVPAGACHADGAISTGSSRGPRRRAGPVCTASCAAPTSSATAVPARPRPGWSRHSPSPSTRYSRGGRGAMGAMGGCRV